MKIRHFCALIALSAGCLLVGCHSDIDLNNIDTTANVEMGLAVPVGSMTFTIGDFLGSGQVNQIGVDEWGIFHFKDTLALPRREYHQIDPSSYLIKNQTQLDFRIKEALPSVDVLPASSTPTTLRFNMELSVEGINKDITQERIDSIRITKATFTSLILCHYFGLQWSDILGIQLELGDQFRPWNGNKLVDIPVEGHKFNEYITVDVENFTLNLLKNAEDPSQGTVDKIQFAVIFTVQPSQDLVIEENSQFLYDMIVRVLDYDAIWGYFEAGNQMRDKNTVVMSEVWEGWNDLKKLELRIAEPKIDMYVSHKVAAPLIMRVDYLRVANDYGKTAAATWYKDGETREYDEFQILNILSPLMSESQLTDSVIVKHTFSYKAHEGHIDQLFDIKPDVFEYSYFLTVDKNTRDDYPYNQHRITKDAAVSGFAAIDVPFKFGENSKLEYSSTLDSVPFLNSISLDSILSSAKVLNDVNATSIKLILDVENSIPFAIDGKFYFIGKDEQGNDKEMDLQLIQDSTFNHLHFPAPEMSAPEDEGDFGKVIAPSKTRLVVDVDKNDFDKLSEVKKLRFDASLTDNPQPCRLDKSASIKVRIGLSAKADVVLNFDDEKK